jgi:signal transduction histidine kinase/ligand-binding sensor domain-containing protein/AraC-like DNA-binding protein
MPARILLIIFLSFIFRSPSSSQKIDFEHITSPESLLNQTVNAIHKDSYGFMWFGTYYGLYKYDGYNAKCFLYDPQDPYFGDKGDVRCFFENRDSILFIGTQYGLCIYNRDYDTFTRYNHENGKPNSISHNHVMTILGDKRGSIWIGTASGLDKFDLKTGTFKHYHPFGEKNYVISITEDKQGNLWLYGGTEVCKFNPDKNTFDYMKISDNQKLKDPLVNQGAILYDSKENLWVGNKVEGLFKFNMTSGEREIFSKENGKLKSDLVGSLSEDADGSIWIGTDGGGLYRYDHQRKYIQRFEHNANDATTLSGNAIHSIFATKNGTLWIGMYNGGIDVYKKNKRKFLKFTATGEPGKIVSQKSILSFAESKDNKIWIGTDGGGLNLFNPKTFEFKYFNEENEGTCANVVKSLLVDKENNLWSGSYRKGLCRMDIAKGSLKNYRAGLKKSDRTILKDNVWSLRESFDGKIWIGLLAGGLDIYDKNTEIFNHNSFDTISSDRVVSVLFEDSKKRMWIGSENAGAVYYDPFKKRYIRVNTNAEVINDIRDIFEDSNGDIWFATKGGGLKRLFVANNKVETFTIENGLATNNILNILEDDHHNLWLSTDKGISCFKRKENKFQNFDIGDGLQSTGFNYGSKLKGSDGCMFFGGLEGFNMFHPDSIQFNLTPPPVCITGFKIFNHLIEPNMSINGRIYLSKSIEQTKEIHLTYHDNVFSIEFVALSFISPLKNKYAYKLEGFDHEWTEVNADKRFANYTNLNPGEYTFRVKASNSDGIWNNKGAYLKIIILPPWWMTWWFKLIAVFSMLTGVFLIIYFRTRTIKIQNKLLEEEVKKQTAVLKNMNSDLMEKNKEILFKSKILEDNNLEIVGKTERILEQQEKIIKQNKKLEEFSKTKDKFYSIIAHDLKNPVYALTVLSKMLRKEFKEASGTGKELIHNLEVSSERIKNLILNLTEWTKSQTEKIEVSPVKLSVMELVEENIELHSMQALQKELSIKQEIDHKLFVTADYNMADTIVRNILSNSIKYTPRGGTILIAAYEENGEIIISFKDSGVGISKGMLENLFHKEIGISAKGTDNETGTGLGLIISKEFAELNNGNLSVESKEGEGSTFYLCLPGGVEEIKGRKAKEAVSVIEGLLRRKIAKDAIENNDEGIIIKEEFRGKRILLVDDDDQVRNSVKNILSDIFEVYEAPDVKTAMELSVEKFPDLIISDIMMPGETGISFCYSMKSNRVTSHIPVILLTGQTSEESHLEGLTAGANAYITKPFDKKILLITVNNLLTSLENMKLRFSYDTEILPSDFTRNILDEELLSKAIKFIESNISDPELNGDLLCKVLGISKRVLYVKLKNIAGQTVNEFIRTIRLKKSTVPLIEGKLNITQISTEMGFNSASYFTRSFTKHFGLSPKEYISKQKSSLLQ